METAAGTANTTGNSGQYRSTDGQCYGNGIPDCCQNSPYGCCRQIERRNYGDPYALAAAAAIALGYGLYKLVTYQTEAEKAQSKLNETIKEADKSLQSELYQINLMFARLKAAKEGTDEYKDAKQAIISQYGEYLKKLGDEKTAPGTILLRLTP